MKQSILILSILFSASTSLFALNNDTCQVDQDVSTNLYFTATNGAKWPIYMTPSGDRYAVRTSKVTGKQYIYVLPGSDKISSDRFFYVTYRYTDDHGIGRVSSFVWSSRYAYPKQSDLRLHAADITCGDHHCIQITGIDAICKADYKAFSK